MIDEAQVSAGTQAGITVIMPAHNAAHYLKRSLPPLAEMLRNGDILELVVVDDQSQDDTAEVAAAHGARVIKMERNGGPGAVRNHAAVTAKGELLWFIDADVVVHPGGPAIIRETLQDHTVDAVFGSYDETPPALNFASQYKNLTHRFYHQRAKKESSTFWSGCGAVRRDVFRRMGGFDVKMFRKPSVEDIELGYRVRAAGGRVLLRSDMLSTHLKMWTVREVVYTDIFRRALPWSRLLIKQGEVTDDLNVNTAERVRALLAGVMFLSVVLGLMFPMFWFAPLIAALLVFWANSEFFRFMMKARGFVFAIGSMLFHQIYYIYSGIVFSYAVMEDTLRNRARV